jgi:hypothetical protein
MLIDQYREFMDDRLDAQKQCKTRSWQLLHNIIDLLNLHKTLQGLRESGTSATLNRLFKSQHVRDLKLIAGVACWISLLMILLSPLVLVYSGMGFIQKYFTVFGAVLAVSGAVVAWVYRTASVRLGVVDLFASEIMTLCRVGTTVDMVQRSIAALGYAGQNDHGKGDIGTDDYMHHFTSKEEYFPVFSSNSHDLEVLEADVVTNVTAFYTYMKVVRDYLRKAGDQHQNATDLQRTTVWRKTWKNIIYMQFLAYETARKAIKDLVEYEPTHVENTIVILLTELVAYRFLLNHFENDFRAARLNLRLQEYQKIAKELEDKITERNGDEAEWDKAIELWPELRNRLEKLGIQVRNFPRRTGREGMCVAVVESYSVAV